MQIQDIYFQSESTIPVPSSKSIIKGAPNAFMENLLRSKLERFEGEGAKPSDFEFIRRDSLKPEAYDITIAENDIQIFSSGDCGAFYALQTLFRFFEGGVLPLRTIHCETWLPMRGIKLYLPEPTPQFIEEWKQSIDIAARYHINTVMIELGGALEYKSHPEINEGWLEYAAFMNEYTGKAHDVHQSIPWHKNSVHAANGHGKVVSQDLMFELLQYCRERYMEVIPEMPSLSHCDYLMTRHPELSERPDDPYPDTCCPSNPDYYKLIFDLFDEVIDLFEPKRIHIGHDEYYTMCLCDKCKGKNAPELYADDIKKIEAHLAERGVKTMIWGEKLLNSHFSDGTPIGGAACFQPDGKTPIPALYPCADLIPNSVEILHWYWSIDRAYDEEYVKRNFHFVFGNFNPCGVPEWERRSHQPGFNGYMISNWGDADFRTMQRNGIYFSMAYAYAISWNFGLTPECHRTVLKWCLADLHRMRLALYDRGTEFITICHTTDTKTRYVYFVDGNFVDEKQYLLGHHVIKSKATGREYLLPVILGTNIATDTVNGIREDDPDDLSDSPGISNRFKEITCETLPKSIYNKTLDKMQTWYEVSYVKPEKDAEFVYCRFRPANALTTKVEVYGDIRQ